MVQFRVDILVNPQGVVQGTRQVQRSLRGVETQADRLRTTLARTFAALGGALAVRQVIDLADSFTALENRIRLVAASQAELDSITESLFRIAERTRQSFEGTGAIYSRIAVSARELGRTQQELLQFTESLNQAIALSGASGQEATAGLIQLSQGLASGALRGDELRSVLEQLPAVADVIAQELGVTRGQLRLLGEQGLISSNIILDAFENAREELAQRFATTVPTVSQAFAVLRTRFTELVADFNRGSGVTNALAQGLLTLAQNLDTVVAFARNLALVLGPRLLLGAVRTLTAAIAANPFGLLVVGIAAVVTAVPQLQEAFNSFIQTLNAVGRAIVEQIDFSGILIGAAGVVDQVIAVFSGLSSALGAIFDAIGSRPRDVGQLIVLGFRNAAERVLDIYLAVFGTIGNIVTGVGQDILAVVSNSIAALSNIARGRLDVAQTFADNAESAVNRAANRVTTFAGQFESTFARLNAVEFLPEVDISNSARDLGADVAAEFARGFEAAGAPVTDAVAGALARGAAQASPTGPVSPQSALPERPTRIQQTVSDFEELDRRIAALDGRADFGSGISRGLLRLQREAQDLAAVGEQVVNVFADRATDALIEFTETGRFNFREFANAILEDLLRIIIRLLVVQALNAAFGGNAGVTNAVGTGVGAAARQAGGPVQPGRTFLVGERGPELFAPTRGGVITPTNELMRQPEPPPPPVVNNIIVRNPDEIPEALNNGSSDKAVINIIARNREQIRTITQ
jgi:tape measure domain-containing protein